MGKYKKLDEAKLQHKKLKKKQANLPIKLENIYNKYSENKTHAIKKRKTIKKRNNLFLNNNKNKATKKKIKKTSLNNLKSIQKGGDDILTKSKYLSKIKSINSSLLDLNNELSANLTELLVQKDKLVKIYINPFKEDIDFILDKFANTNIDFLDTEDSSDSSESFTIMKKRMVMLNKIFRFSTQVGQTFKKTNIDSKYFKINNKPKNFYYKHSHQRGTKFMKNIFITRGNSKIKTEFYIDTVWSQIAVYREFEINVRRIIKMIALKLDDKKKNDEQLQDPESAVSTLQSANTTLTAFYDSYNKNLTIYNKFNKNDIHFYLKKMNINNMGILLLKIPKRKKGITTIFTNIKKTITRSQEDYKKDRTYDIKKATKEGLLDKHQAANNLLIKKCQIIIDNFFEQIDEGKLLKSEEISYLTNYKIINDLDDNFFKINNIFLFNLEKKPYLDMGQVSMLSYENELTTNLATLKQDKKDKHRANSIYNKDEIHIEYFNNILHLPNFILKYLDISMIESAEETYEDDYYKKINGQDKGKLDDIIDTTKFFKQNYSKKKKLKNIHKFNKDELKLNSNVRKAYEGKASEQIKKDDDNNNANIQLINTSKPIDNTSDEDLKNNFFMPISTYHALFKIKNFDAITKVKINRAFFGKKKLSFSKRQNIGKGISKLFFINKYDDIIPGTILYLYKQIAFHLDFLYNNNPGKIGLYELFLKELINFSLLPENKKDLAGIAREIKRNVGIFRGIDNRELYLYYAMLIIMEHANRLLQCVNDLKYLTDKVYKVNEQNTDIIDSYNDLKKKAAVADFMDLHTNSGIPNPLTDATIYRTDDTLSNDNKHKISIKDSAKYKQLIFDIKTYVHKELDIDIISDIIKHLSNLKKESDELPELLITDYINNVPYGIDKLALDAIIRVPKENFIQYNNADLETEKKYLYDIIKDITFVERNDSINFNSTDFNKILTNTKVGVKDLKTELFYLIIKLFELTKDGSVHSTTDDYKTLYFDKIKANTLSKEAILSGIRTFIKNYKINISSDRTFELILSELSLANITETDDTFINPDINDKFKEIFKFIKLFNILNKDMFLFFTNKTFREKFFYLNNLKAKIPYYQKHYKEVTHLNTEIDETIKLLEQLQKIDEQIERKFIDIIINKGHNIKITYSHNGTTGIQEIKFEDYKKADTTQLVDTDVITYEGHTINNLQNFSGKYTNPIHTIKIEDFKKKFADKTKHIDDKDLPDYILGHISLIKDPIYNPVEIQVLRQTRISIIEKYNEKMSKISLFNELLYLYMTKQPSSNVENVTDTKLFPIQFIFMKPDIITNEDNTNYLIYKEFESGFARTLNTDKSNTYIAALNTVFQPYVPFLMEDIRDFDTLLLSAVTDLTLLIKKSDFYKDIIEIRSLELKIENIQQNIAKADATSIEKYELEKDIHKQEYETLSDIKSVEPTPTSDTEKGEIMDKYNLLTKNIPFKIWLFKEIIGDYLDKYNITVITYYTVKNTLIVIDTEKKILDFGFFNENLVSVTEKQIHYTAANIADNPFMIPCKGEIITKFIKIYNEALETMKKLSKEKLQSARDIDSRFINYTIMYLFKNLLDDEELMREEELLKTTSKIGLEKEKKATEAAKRDKELSEGAARLRMPPTAIAAAEAAAATSSGLEKEQKQENIKYQNHTFIPELINDLIKDTPTNFKAITILDAPAFTTQIKEAQEKYTVPIEEFKSKFDVFSLDLFTRIKENFILIDELAIKKIMKQDAN